ncbi:MAG TPA: CoA-binding protein [Streptosporangiaceae bacterium]|nr:CoA-binding protein [Streptosporangiaceae bacterium]
MQTMKQAAAEFLAGKRVAVTGVSRNSKDHGSNVVYQRLRQRGYQVFAVNPNADQVEGDTCYHDLASVPGGVDWVMIGTRPQTAEATMRECADLGIKRVWMHRRPGAGSVSPAAAEYGRQHGITVIEGGCPCMFAPTADPGHKAMRFVFTLTGNVPRRVLRPGLHLAHLHGTERGLDGAADEPSLVCRVDTSHSATAPYSSISLATVAPVSEVRPGVQRNRNPLLSWEPVSGIEPLTCRLQEVRP